MAYVVWRVFMKKYCKVRLGVNRNLPAPSTPINPVERPVPSVDTKWDSNSSEPPPLKPAPTSETPIAPCSRPLESNEEAAAFTQDKSIRRSSKTQRVKSYLKKCKDAALGTTNPSSSEGGANASSAEMPSCEENRNKNAKRLSQPSNSKEVSSNTCWYVAESFETSSIGNQIPVVEINPSDVEANGTSPDYDDTIEAEEAEEALTVTFETCKIPITTECRPTLNENSGGYKDAGGFPCGDASLPVGQFSHPPRGATSADVSVAAVKEGTCVASLVERYLGHLYVNFDRSRSVLVRQARDLLVCTFHGNLTAFEKEFLAPAALLLQTICQAARKDGRDAVAPRGWPLCLGDHGVTLQLGELDPTLLRNRDCYLCVGGRASSVQVALVWRYEGQLGRRPLGDDIDALETPVTLDMAAADAINEGNLSGLLQNLLLSVERAIERVPLDDLAFPCPQCHAYLLPTDYPEDSGVDDSCGCQCSCKQSGVQKKDTSMQTSPMFEFAGTIPHIDSDEDDDGYTGNYTRKISQDSGIQTSTASTMTTPTTTTPRDELVPPKSITHLPDKLLLSGIHLPGTHDSDGRPLVLYDTLCVSRTSLTHLQIATTMLYYATIPSAETMTKGMTVLVVSGPAESSALLLLDKAFTALVSHVKIGNVLLWRQDKVQAKWQKKTNTLERSQIQYHVVADDAELRNFLAEDQVPATCGGRSNHDQLEWVEFHKELEPFLAQCHECGRRLVGAMTELRTTEAQGNVTRRQLHHQHRALSRAINAPELHRLRREGAAALGRLEQRAQWLPASQHVRLALERARRMFAEVDRASRRLEELADGRRERLRELARVRALEDETEQVLSWLCKKGEDTLVRHTQLATSLQAIKQQEHDFEKFYFISMRHLDKGSDLVEAAGQCSSETRSDGARGSLKDLARSLKTHLRGFGERLEDTRERLEDTSRCFYLLDKAYEWALETMKYLSRVGVVEEVQTPDQAMQMLKMIQQYLMAHPSLSEDHFQEMLQLAAKLGNEKLQQQAKVAHSRCQETMETIRTQQSRLVQLRRMLGGEDDRPTSPQPTHQGWKPATSTPSGAVGRRRSVGSNPYIYKCSHHAAGHTCSCWDPAPSPIEDCCCGNNSRNNPPCNLGNIQEVRESAEDLLDAAEENSSEKREDLCGRCSGPVNSQSNVLSKRQLRRSCTWQYPTENFDEERLCEGDDNSGDNTTEGSEGCAKSGENGDDLDEQELGNKCVPPVPVNSHLHCNASTLDLSNSLAEPGTTQHKTHRTLLYIMREMIQTERDYVKSLEYIIENYIPELLREDIPQALRGQRNVIFGNVEKIYEFHSQYFLQELEKYENSPLQIGQSFLRHEKKFYLYALYNKNKPKSDAIMSEYGTSFFKAKQVELGDKMDLASYLLKPVQRMGKYALLLQQLIKACSDKVPEGDKECLPEKGPEVDTNDMKAADKMVRFQLRHGNDLLAMDSLRDCDVNVKEQGRLLRQNEFLVWQGKGKKCLRHVFLFEELILFSKARRFPDRKNLDLYIYKNSIKMTDIGLTAKIGDSPTKFEIWFRKRKPNDTFTIQSMSDEIKQAWTEELSKLLWKQALRNRESRLAEMSSMGIGNKPCLDIRPSKDQINDRSITFAQLSKTAPRFRSSITVPPGELLRTNKRPHSIISVSSSSSSGGSSTSHSSNYGALINLGFDPADSPRLHHRSATLNSQCSMESGIIADISLGSEDTDSSGTHWCVERSNSSATSTSLDSAASPTSPTDEGRKAPTGDTEQQEFYIKL